MEPLTLTALVAAGGYGAIRGLSAFARRRFGEVPPVESITFDAADGWRLGADHHRPAGPSRGVVILCHGLGINRFFWNPAPPIDVPALLVDAGFEVFNVDVRGGGHSRWSGPGKPPSWTFGTHVTADVPAVIEAALARSGAEQVHWVGHSMGGMLLLAWLGLHPDDPRIASGTVIGSPTVFKDAHWTGKAVTATVGSLARVLPGIPSSVMPWMTPFMPAVRFPTHLLDFGNFDGPVLRRMLYHTYESIHPALVRQFAVFFREDTWTEGETDYRANLAHITTPMLFIAGAGDRVAPPQTLRFAHDRVRSADKRLIVAGRAEGYAIDYCHGSLIAGRPAPEEIHPLLLQWLVDHAGSTGGPV